MQRNQVRFDSAPIPKGWYACLRRHDRQQRDILQARRDWSGDRSGGAENARERMIARQTASRAGRAYTIQGGAAAARSNMIQRHSRKE